MVASRLHTARYFIIENCSVKTINFTPISMKFSGSEFLCDLWLYTLVLLLNHVSLYTLTAYLLASVLCHRLISAKTFALILAQSKNELLIDFWTLVTPNTLQCCTGIPGE